MPELEGIRDRYDRTNFVDEAGMELIGLPAIEKRLARYPPLYSRLGFLDRFRLLSGDELRFILAHKRREVGPAFSPDDYTDAEALASIARITGGNFRLVQRLFAQIARVLGGQPAADHQEGGRRDRPREAGHRPLKPRFPEIVRLA